MKGDMDAMKGYNDDMYRGGDFDETRGRNRCSVCHQLGHKASRHKNAVYIVLFQCICFVCVFHFIAFRYIVTLKCFLLTMLYLTHLFVILQQQDGGSTSTVPPS